MSDLNLFFQQQLQRRKRKEIEITFSQNFIEQKF